MATSYILIDYENVQPKDVAALKDHPSKLFLFVGSNQSKIPMDLAEALQARGEGAAYVRIKGNGRNALDFHIALYLGELSFKEPQGCFYVISKDKGFDPLMQFLQARSVNARRCNALSELPVIAACAPKSLDERVGYIVRDLRNRGTSRPRKQKTLASTINALFGKSLDDAEVQQLVAELERRRCIAIQDGTVSYMLEAPDDPSPR